MRFVQSSGKRTKVPWPGDFLLRLWESCNTSGGQERRCCALPNRWCRLREVPQRVAEHTAVFQSELSPAAGDNSKDGAPRSCNFIPPICATCRESQRWNEQQLRDQVQKQKHLASDYFINFWQLTVAIINFSGAQTFPSAIGIGFVGWETWTIHLFFKASQIRKMKLIFCFIKPMPHNFRIQCHFF